MYGSKKSKSRRTSTLHDWFQEYFFNNVFYVPKTQQKMAKKYQKVQKSIKKAGIHSIVATIHTRRENVCLLYGGFDFYI